MQTKSCRRRACGGTDSVAAAACDCLKCGAESGTRSSTAAERDFCHETIAKSHGDEHQTESYMPTRTANICPHARLATSSCGVDLLFAAAGEDLPRLLAIGSVAFSETRSMTIINPFQPFVARGRNSTHIRSYLCNTLDELSGNVSTFLQYFGGQRQCGQRQ